ncbi:MAG: hypothetical protein KBT35_01395 [Firmicutes bacterium]|nr:hypothetical protein [Candidatus Colivicinus equi]
MDKIEALRLYRIKKKFLENTGLRALGEITQEEYHKRNKKLCEKLDKLEAEFNDKQ